MKSGAFAVLLAVAAAVTGGALYLLGDRDPLPQEGNGPPAAADGGGNAQRRPAPAAEGAQGAGTLRPYQTIETLTEDLRDALAHGTPPLEQEWLRVSAALEPYARRALAGPARDDPNPRVRALLVLAAGVHHPDAAALLGALKDRSPVVGRAAVLACGYKAGGRERFALWPGLEIPLGRKPESASLSLLELAGERGELGAGVEAVRRAAGISPPR